MCDNNTHAPQIKRHFWKCQECLSYCAIEQPGMNAWDRVKCGLCDSFMWYMGRVEQTRLKRDEVHCACDYRCTSATGPKCNCQCGGVNHGKHAVVHVIVDAGAVPVAQVKPDARILRELREYRALRQILSDEWQELNSQGRLSREQWNRKIRLSNAIGHARTLTSHAGRMKALANVGHVPQRQTLPTPAASSEALAPVKTAKAGCLF